MAKTVNEAFDQFLGRLTPSGTETEAARKHRESIKACLTNNFGLYGLFRFGSFGHGTSVSGYSDIDYFAVIPRENLTENSDPSLRKIKEKLANRFPQTNVYVRSPAVVVPFGSKASEVHEIIPADYLRKINGYHVYDIPDRDGGWMKASPSAHNDYVDGLNNKLDKRLKPLVRFVKAWKYYRGVPLRSFYLELRVAQYGSGESSIMYKIDVKRTFRHLLHMELRAMQDPQGISGYVYAGTDAEKDDALSKLRTALSRAENALAAEKDGDIRAAFAWWDEVFNGKFPAHY